MKRFAILLSVALILLVVIVVYDNADLSNDEPALSATEATTMPTGTACEHVFSEASFIRPRTCEICKATEGEPLCMQCETWEEVIACAGFEEYSYDLQVMDSEDLVILSLTLDDNSLFATEETANRFMLRSYLSFIEISWFSQNRLGVTTPETFQVDISIRLSFPDGSITCVPVDNSSRMGFTTMLSCKEGSQNKAILERAYNRFFSTVKIEK